MSVLQQQLNDQQRDAVKTVTGPLLIIAGAGSGKTRVITFRIAYMLEQGIPQSQILALTFTNKAAREMEERVREITGRKLSNLTVSTFHAFGVRLLKREIVRLGYRRNFTIYDAVDRISLIKEVARELKLVYESQELSFIANLFSSIKTGRVSWDSKNDHHQELYQEYQEHLKLFNAVDFDDLIMLPIKLLEEFPQVREEYQDRFRYIMVDEFQDTSIAQYRLMYLLAQKNENICVVGDDDQSIYSWRGANYENLLQFERDFPSLKEIKLEQNYRSTGIILSAANAVIANNTNRKVKELWTGITGGTSIGLFYPDDDKAEAEYIAESIATLKMRHQVPFDHVGILIRTNSLSRSIEEALLTHDIPYTVSGGTSFFERKEIKDMIAYLRVIDNPDDDMNLLRIINTPRRGIGKKTLQAINDLANGQRSTFYSALTALVFAADSPLPDRAKSGLAEFLDLIETYRDEMTEAEKKKKMAPVVRELLEDIGYWGYLVQEHQKSEKVARWKYDNIRLFIDSFERWEKNPDNLKPTLNKYLNRITLMNREDDKDKEKKVNLMTIHAAKGLEFDYVFLAGVEKNIIPHERAVEEDPANVEEERRLFYVAITRARKKLFMTSCRTRKQMRETVECEPSPFLQEIPHDLTEMMEEEAEVEAEEAMEYFAAMKNMFGKKE